MTLSQRTLTAGFVAFALGTLPVQVSASPRATVDPGTPVSNAPAEREVPSDARTLELERRINELFQLGDYEAALPLMEEVYAQTRAPRWLFNLGVLHHALGDCPLALDHYRRYRQSGPGGEGRAEVDAAIASLEPICGAPAAMSAPRVVVAPALAPPAKGQMLPLAPERARAGATGARASAGADEAQGLSTRAVVGWSLLGAGAVTSAAAVISLVLARDAVSDLNALGREAAARSRAGETYDVCCAARGRELENQRGRYTTLTPILGAGSLLLLAAGTTLLVLDVNDRGSLTLGASGFRYRARF